MNANPEPYSERKRLAAIIGDARLALAEPYDNSRAGLAARTGRLEALLDMLASSAQRTLRLPDPDRPDGWAHPENEAPESDPGFADGLE